MKNADSVFIYWNHCHRHTFSSRRLSIIQRIYYCRPSCSIYDFHDDDMTWKNLVYYWPFLGGNPIFHVAGPRWGESIPSLGLVTWSFDVFFVTSLNKFFTKQFSHLCFESMTSCDVTVMDQLICWSIFLNESIMILTDFSKKIIQQVLFFINQLWLR